MQDNAIFFTPKLFPTKNMEAPKTNLYLGTAKKWDLHSEKKILMTNEPLLQ